MRFSVFKIIYPVLISLGLIAALFVAFANWPHTKNLEQRIVKCSNGKSFDPLSKSIGVLSGVDSHGYPQLNEGDINSICQFDNISIPSTLPSNSFSYEYPVYKTIIEGDIPTAIFGGVLVFAIYLFLLEVFRRIILLVWKQPVKNRTGIVSKVFIYWFLSFIPAAIILFELLNNGFDPFDWGFVKPIVNNWSPWYLSFANFPYNGLSWENGGNGHASQVAALIMLSFLAVTIAYIFLKVGKNRIFLAFIILSSLAFLYVFFFPYVIFFLR